VSCRASVTASSLTSLTVTVPASTASLMSTYSHGRLPSQNKGKAVSAPKLMGRAVRIPGSRVSIRAFVGLGLIVWDAVAKKASRKGSWSSCGR
jgi:hypothetical protein